MSEDFYNYTNILNKIIFLYSYHRRKRCCTCNRCSRRVGHSRLLSVTGDITDLLPDTLDTLQVVLSAIVCYIIIYSSYG